MKKSRNGVETANVVITGPNGKECEVESNGALAINIQDQHSRALDLFFINSTNETTLSADADPDDMTITVTSTTGFVDGASVGVFGGVGTFYFGQQIGAPAGNVITLDTPMDVQHLSGSPVIVGSRHLNVNGSVTTQVFQIGPIGTIIEVDITRITGYLQAGSAMDDSKFGDIAGGLTDGVVLRVNNGDMQNIWNVKTNGEFGLLCFDSAYTPRAPAGSEGFRFRNTYAGPSKHGVTLRLEVNDTLEVLIQDNLSTLEEFLMMAQGHVVTD